MDLETLALVWLFSALLATIIGAIKGRAKDGFVLGLLLGFIGAVITAFLPRTAAVKAAEIRDVNAALGTNPAGWWPDPHGRHQHRYWDGTRWTEHVSDAGIVSVD